ncbi:MAG TPA: hypothetical protein VET23_11805 [Chitinophagaceae bacterium]|nr:hypothetical protein [Chitinophagaceae bacterium]
MKRLFLSVLLAVSLHSYSQTVFGYWYGYANVKIKSSANNYLIELILNPGNGYVKGIMNYYFKNTYRSVQVKGNYSPSTRHLSLYEIPIPYYGSVSDLEVFCTMNLQATLRVAKAGSNLVGSFISLPQYKYTCADITFNLKLNADISKEDSVLKAIREYKETLQVWTPTYTDTAVAVNIIPRKVVNYVIEKEFTERENVIANEIEVVSDSLKVDFYDNGEVDGDSISVFFNKKLIAFHQLLSTRAVHFDIVLDSSQKINELTMFADNLGSIPPNTALMVIYDGEKRYDVRLSSNLEKNATVRIKRKKDHIKSK